MTDPDGAPDAPPERPRLVMVVEDDADGLDAVCEVVRELGHDPMGARSAREALSLLRAGFRPGVILLDLGLPDMSGERVLDEARRLGPTNRHAVLLMSGRHDVSDVAARYTEIVGVLPKPLSLEAVRRAFESMSPRPRVTSRFHGGSAQGGRPYRRTRSWPPPHAPARLLADAGEMLAQSVDATRSIGDVLGLVVPSMADWGVVEAWDDEGALRPIAARHPRADRAEVLHRALERAGGRGLVRTVGDAFRAGEPLLRADLDESALREVARDPELVADLVALDTRSILVVPMVARGEVFGTLTLANPGAGSTPSSEQLGIVSDLAHRMALALDSARLVAHLRRAVRAREDLLAVVSHDLRAPLSNVRFAAAGLARRAESGSREAGDAARILRACDRMDHLIRDLLDFSQLEAGSLRLRPRPTDLAELLEQAAEGVRELARDRSVLLDVAPELRGARAFCDRHRLLQALGNLLSNALHYAPPGTVVELCARRVEDEVRISVRDSGPGIPQDELPRLFEPYRQGNGDEASHGSRSVGLGLYIAKSLVAAHGGWIAVDSCVGEGSEFTIGLPFGAGSEDEITPRLGSSA